MKKDTRRKILWGFGVLAVLCPLSLCGLGYYAFQTLFVGPGQALPQELKLATQAGMPLTPKDLRPLKPLPEDQNAARIYRAFFPVIDRVLKADKRLREDVPNMVKGMASKEAIARVTHTLDSIRESLAQIKAASQRPHCDFQYRYENGSLLELPHFAPAKATVRLLCARAYLSAERGDIDGALSDVAAARRISAHMGEVPVLVGALVELSTESMAIAELSHVLRVCARRKKSVDKAQRVFAGFGELVNLRRAFGGELVLGRVTIPSIKSTRDIETLSGEEPRRRRGLPIPASVVRGFEAKFVSTWREVFVSTPADPKDWPSVYNSFVSLEKRLFADESPLNAVNRAMFPVLSQPALAVIAQIANRRLTATSIRLIQIRQESGGYPATLPGDLGEITIDPFDGKPLRYQRQGSGFKIYSIGRDFKDDGGVIKPSTQTPSKATSPSGPTSPIPSTKGDIVRTFE